MFIISNYVRNFENMLIISNYVRDFEKYVYNFEQFIRHLEQNIRNLNFFLSDQYHGQIFMVYLNWGL